MLSSTYPEFDPAWEDWLRLGYAHWALLDDSERERMRFLTASFHSATRWEAANGFELTEPMKVVISAQASMLLLGLELDEYPQLTSVIVYPSTVIQRGERVEAGNVRSSSPRRLAGEAHYRGPVVLSWTAVRGGARSPERGQNVVYHEFAHQLDMLDGITDGTPPLDDEAARRRWIDVCTRAFDSVRADRSAVLRPYAGTNPAEFFAVATEVFLNRPADLRDHEQALYTELVGFYGQDPASRTTTKETTR